MKKLSDKEVIKKIVNDINYRGKVVCAVLKVQDKDKDEYNIIGYDSNGNVNFFEKCKNLAFFEYPDPKNSSIMNSIGHVGVKN